MTKIVLVGHAITAGVLNSYLRRDRRFDVVGLTVDDEFLDQGGVAGLPAVGLSQLQERFPPATTRLLMAVGYNDLNRVRESLFMSVKAMGYGVETYVHPDAKVFTEIPLGEGCVVLPGAVLEPHARLGANSMVWCNVTLAHHSSVDDHCWIASGAVISGQAKVLRNSFIGVNATVVNEVTVGEYNIVGANALMSKDTKSHTVHLARSAEPFRYSSDDYVKYFGV
ncbi:acetyltransferase [uncultured Thiodictyon sp.]|jgi:sugar O-acyltransferase (sialic acid O-acetyltransferase NeuD family)|uniref:acetyltransferase n=1 Tax=uncultured Thiodictyon sp. TaxID=1846217 RepID=UPI0025E13EA1|nr:acetyltransferase [uncultured Thiodictyon sp.]